MDSRSFLRHAAVGVGSAPERFVRPRLSGWGGPLLAALIVICSGYIASRYIANEYVFFAGFMILQFAVFATGWNVLAGFCGYVNFGSGAFLAVGAYTAAFIAKVFGLSLPLQIVCAAVTAGVLGFAVGYLALRISGIYFAIATIAVAVVVQTLILHWDFMGGARGLTSSPPETVAGFTSYNRYLFFVMLILVVISAGLARWLQTSWLGLALRAMRDNEVAAESSGVPTLKVKLIAAAMSGAIMGMSGAPQLAFSNFIEPSIAFNFNYAICALAMPIIGGTAHWMGPLIGALLLGSLQQAVTVTISSELNVLIIGVLLVVFVVAAPHGIMGAWENWRRRDA